MKDREWLKQKLCTALGWDGVVVEGVVEAIDSASTAQEVDIIVQVNRKIKKNAQHDDKFTTCLRAVHVR